MRRLFPYLAAIGLLCFGATVWFFVRDWFAAPQGIVSGDVTATPFWQDGTLVLGGADGETLVRLANDGSADVVMSAAAERVAAFARSEDGTAFFLVTRNDRDATEELWLLKEGEQRFLFALRGEVRNAAFSKDKGFVSFLFTPEDGRTTEAALFDVSRKKYWTAADDATDVLWTDRPEGLLVLDTTGKIWYHDRASFFTETAPSLVGETLGGMAWRGASGDVIVTAADENGGIVVQTLSLVAQSVSTDEATAPLVPSQRTLALSPDGTALLLQLNDEQKEDPPLALYRFADGTYTTLPTTARRLRWFDDATALLEHTRASSTTLSLFSMNDGIEYPIAFPTPLHLAP